MQISKSLQIVAQDGYGLCFHSLLGNLRLLEPKYLNFIKNNINSDLLMFTDEEQKISDELMSVGFVEKLDDSRQILKRKNEVWMRKVADGKTINLLNLMVSESCNFGCQHCLHRCSVEKYDTHNNRQMMTWSTAKKAIDTYFQIIDRSDHDSINIHFGSPEPLLNWEVVKLASSYIRKAKPKAKIAINTNLSMIDRDKAIFIRDNGIQISTSLDGPKNANDIIRPYHDGSGTFDDIRVKETFGLLDLLYYGFTRSWF